MSDWMPTIAVLGIYTLAVVSPGPNFLVIARQALSHSRAVGLRTAFGVASGSILWIGLGFFGLAALLVRAPFLLSMGKIAGALYLLYLAYRMLRAPAPGWPPQTEAEGRKRTGELRNAYWTGLLTQLSNPKAALFILALFTSVISPTTPSAIKLLLATAMAAISFTWYVLVGLVFSHNRWRQGYQRVLGPTNAAFTGLMVYLAAAILLTA